MICIYDIYIYNAYYRLNHLIIILCKVAKLICNNTKNQENIKQNNHYKQFKEYDYC